MASRSSKVSAPAQATGRTSPMRSPRSTIAGLHSFTLIPRGALLAVPLLAMLRCHGETIGERLLRDLKAFHCLPPAPYDACEKKAGQVSSQLLVRYRGTDYSVPTAYGHREVLIRGYVHEVVISCGAA